MDPLSYFISLITNLNNLNALVQTYGIWVYLVLFAIIFSETGLVVIFFFPGDSLLFVAGTFAAAGSLIIWALIPLLALAAITGNTVNYAIGRFIGPRAFKSDSRLLKKRYLEDAQHFYERHGKATIFITRFIPVIRTFAPFVAGIGRMRFLSFMAYNILGGVSWVLLLTLGGFFFGNMPIVKSNFTLAVYAIVIISLMPAFIAFLRQYHHNRAQVAKKK
jgi:membrane-associated protein